MPGTDVPPGSTAILDSSVLIAMGAPSNDKFQAFERFVTRWEITVRIPDHLAVELGESPDAYEYQHERLRAARNTGWLERAEVDFSNPGVSEAVDRTRKRMLNLSADDVTEDEIEKTDTILAGLAYQHTSADATQVTVFVSDSIAERAIGDVLTAMDTRADTVVVEGRSFLATLEETDQD